MCGSAGRRGTGPWELGMIQPTGYRMSSDVALRRGGVLPDVCRETFLVVGELDHTFALNQCPHPKSRGRTPTARGGAGRLGVGTDVLCRSVRSYTRTARHQRASLANGCERLLLRVGVSPGQTLNERCERFANV